MTVRIALHQRLMISLEFRHAESVDDDNGRGAIAELCAAAQQRAPHCECRRPPDIDLRDFPDARGTEPEGDRFTSNPDGEFQALAVVRHLLGIADAANDPMIEREADGGRDHRPGQRTTTHFVDPDQQVTGGPGEAFVGEHELR